MKLSGALTGNHGQVRNIQGAAAVVAAGFADALRNPGMLGQPLPSLSPVHQYYGAQPVHHHGGSHHHLSQQGDPAGALRQARYTA